MFQLLSMEKVMRKRTKLTHYAFVFKVISSNLITRHRISKILNGWRSLSHQRDTPTSISSFERVLVMGRTLRSAIRSFRRKFRSSVTQNAPGPSLPASSLPPVVTSSLIQRSNRAYVEALLPYVYKHLPTSSSSAS